MGSSLTFVQSSIKKQDGVKMISALQLKRGLVHYEPKFMTIPVVKTEGSMETIPIEIQQVLEEYHKMMP